jgi:hypothetical protein
MPHKLVILPETFAVCRLAPDAPIPDWAVFAGSPISITRTADELSIVGPASRVPDGVQAERGWRCFKILGPLPFTMTGVLASLVAPLAEAGISIFAFSTYDTDYVMVKEETLALARDVLVADGFEIVKGGGR